jgi:hypothetical protein
MANVSRVKDRVEQLPHVEISAATRKNETVYRNDLHFNSP